MKNSYKNIGLDLNEFQKIEDIIFLDEPILTHLKRNDKDYLYYLVDTLEDKDLFLLLEVANTEIFEYLTKRLSLRDIIINNKNIAYLIEQDFKGELLNVEITQGNKIEEDYLPNHDSYLEYKPTENSFYYRLIEDFKTDAYLNLLRQDAFYVKFTPLNKKYSDTIGLNELATVLLSNLSQSFKSFLKADFFNSFKHSKTDKVKLSSTFNKILPDLDYRMVDLHYGSFEIGLAVDTVMKNNIQDKNIKDWASNVGKKYKDLVLDDDYDSVNVDIIMNTFDEEDRKKIFNPIFKITENPNFTLQIKDSKKSNYSTIKIKDKQVIDKIIPTKVDEIAENIKDYQIIQVMTVVDKNNSSKVVKLEDTLFNSYDHTNYVLTNKEFEKYNYSLNFEVNIPLEIETKKDKILTTAIYEGIVFNDINDSGKIEESILKITKKIYEYILNKV